MVVRLNADGSPDAGFGTGGRATAVTGGGYGGYTGVGLLADGRVVAVSARFATNALALAVLNPDGSPNDYFGDGAGVGGVQFGDASRGGVLVGDVAVSGGRIVVVGDLYSTTRDIYRNSLGLAVFTEVEGDRVVPKPPETPVPPRPPVVVTPPVIAPPVRTVVVTPEGLIADPPQPPVLGTPPVSTRGTTEAQPVIPGAVGPIDNPTAVSIAYVPGTSFPLPPRVAGDVNGDGVADKVVTDGAKVSLVSGKDGSVLVKAFAPFEASYAGTLNAVLVDIDDAGFRGGVHLAAGDTNGDGRADLIVTAGEGGGPRVAIFDGKTLGADARRLVADFFAFEASQRGGATAGVANGVLIFGAGPGGGPRVRGIDARSLFAAAGVRSLDDLPTGAQRFDRFVGDASSRQGVKLDFAGVDDAVTDRPNKVTATTADGKPVTVFETPGFTPTSPGR